VPAHRQFERIVDLVQFELRADESRQSTPRRQLKVRPQQTEACRLVYIHVFVFADAF
jgi:hypothetical protein